MIELRHIAPTVAAAIAATSGKQVGNARIPGKESEQPELPFAIVYHLARGEGGETAIGFPHDMTWETIQVTSVANSAERAGWMADQARNAILGKTGGAWTNVLDPDGCEICGRRLGTSGGISLVDGLWQFAERYSFLVTG